MSKEGLAWLTAFTYMLEENCKNSQTVEELISEFHAKTQEEVAAVCQAPTLHKRWSAPAPDEDPNKSLFEAETDAEETLKK